MYGVPLKEIQKYDAIKYKYDKDGNIINPNGVEFKYNGKKKIGNIEWDEIEVKNFEVVSAYSNKFASDFFKTDIKRVKHDCTRLAPVIERRKVWYWKNVKHTCTRFAKVKKSYKEWYWRKRKRKRRKWYQSKYYHQWTYRWKSYTVNELKTFKNSTNCGGLNLKGAPHQKWTYRWENYTVNKIKTFKDSTNCGGLNLIGYPHQQFVDSWQTIDWNLQPTKSNTVNNSNFSPLWRAIFGYAKPRTGYKNFFPVKMGATFYMTSVKDPSSGKYRTILFGGTYNNLKGESEGKSFLNEQLKEIRTYIGIFYNHLSVLK